MKTNKIPSHIFNPFIYVLILASCSVFSYSSTQAAVNERNSQHSENQLIILMNNESDSDSIENLIHTYCPEASIIEQVDNYALVELDHCCDAEKLSELISESPAVSVAEPNYFIQTMQLSKDTYTSSQWALENTGHYRSLLKSNFKKKSSTKGVDLNIKPAWSVYNKNSCAKKEVIVAVIDTVVDVTHEDLAKNIWVNKGESPGDGIDNDGNGYVDDINGWDFYNNDSSLCSYHYDHSTSTYEADPQDNDDHGTHVAGIIGAVSNNRIGIAGAASNIDIKIMPLKIEGGKNGNGTISSAVKAIKYAEKMGAKVCNISWGSSLNSAALAQAIKESSMLFVAAAGNAGTNNDKKPIYPADYNLNNIISVTFIDPDGGLNSLSNYGKKTVDIAAPGYDILSTTVGSSYGSMSGSSMAVPHVSALAAMVYASQNHLYGLQVKDLILQNITPLRSLRGKIIHPGIPDAEKLVYDIHQLTADTTPPSISCSTSYSKKGIQINLSTNDRGGSGIRVIKYLYGRQSLADFESGTVGTTITAKRITVPKSGIYTFYISDYAGNEQRKVYEVKDDKYAPVITSDWSRISHSTLFSVTCSVHDSQSRVREVRYMKGRKKSKDFASSKAGTVLTPIQGVYRFSGTENTTYTIYAVDYRGNKTTHVIKLQ